jgi:hypothetical protein
LLALQWAHGFFSACGSAYDVNHLRDYRAAGRDPEGVASRKQQGSFGSLFFVLNSGTIVLDSGIANNHIASKSYI